MRKRVISQDKDNKGNLGKTTVKNVVSKFKEQYLGLKDSDDTPLAGFELNGGTGMTKKSQEVWDEFGEWCLERNLDFEYNTRDELLIIRENLRNRNQYKIHNIN